MSMNNQNSKALNIVSKIYYVILVIVMYQILIRYNFNDIDLYKMSKNYLAISMILGLAVRIYSAYIWVFLLRAFGSTERMSLSLMSVYSKAWLGRYIPGKLPWIMGKVYFASKFNLSKKRLLACSLLETGLQVIVAGFTGGMLLIVANQSTGISTSLRWFVIVFAFMSVVIMPKHITRFLRNAYLRLKHENITEISDVPVCVVSKVIYMFLMVAVISGLSYFYLITAIYEAYSRSLILYTIGAVNFAGAVGMVSIFAPSGLGVREGVLAFTLSDIMAVEDITKIVIFSRLWAVILDVLFFILSYMATKSFKGYHDRK